MKRLYITLIIICSLIGAGRAQQGLRGVIQIQVNDKLGNPVPNYNILVRPGNLFNLGEVIFTTNASGFAIDTVQIPPSAVTQGSWDIRMFILDSNSTGISQSSTFLTTFSAPSSFHVVDTVFYTLNAPLKGADNCGNYSAWADSVVNDPMYIRFKNNLNRPHIGTHWTYGDGDTGHAPQTFHRYDTAGTYYFCHYTDSCGPVCDSITVPTKVPTCVVKPTFSLSGATINGAQLFINSNYPISQIDSAKWTLSGGAPSAIGSFYRAFLPLGKYQYCLEINACPIFCDSITVNGNCEAGFDIINTTSSGDVFIDNISLPTPNDTVEVNYKWTFGDGGTSNDPFPVHNYQSGGPFNLCLEIEVVDKTTNSAVCASRYCEMLSGGVQGSGFSLNVQNPYMGLDDLVAKPTMSVFPNPVYEGAYISLNPGEKISEITIYSVLGNKVLQQNGQDQNTLFLNLQALKKGVYLMEVETTIGRQVAKFIKE